MELPIAGSLRRSPDVADAQEISLRPSAAGAQRWAHFIHPAWGVFASLHNMQRHGQ